MSIERGTRLLLVSIGDDGWFDDEFIAVGPPDGDVVWVTYRKCFGTRHELESLIEWPVEDVLEVRT